MPIDYARFAAVGCDSSSGSGSDEEKSGAHGTERPAATTEEGLLKQFLAVHEQRLLADRILAGFAPDYEGALQHYDEAFARLLALEGVTSEDDLQAVGHRVEAFHMRFGAARAFAHLEDWQNCEHRASGAIAAMQLDQAAEARLLDMGFLPTVPLGTGSDLGTVGRTGNGLVHCGGARAYICRARARLNLNDARGAQLDAGAALSIARRKRARSAAAGKNDVGDDGLIAEAEQLAIEAQMALDGVGTEYVVRDDEGPPGKASLNCLFGGGDSSLRIASVSENDSGAFACDAGDVDQHSLAHGCSEVHFPRVAAGGFAAGLDALD